MLEVESTIVRLEGLGQLKKSNDLIGNRTRNLPACSIVPQPTTLPRTPASTLDYIEFLTVIIAPIYFDHTELPTVITNEKLVSLLADKCG
jgi:hypothetical protein